MLLNLINNIAFLVALVAAGQMVITRFPHHALNRQLLLGLLFGGVTLLGMANPVNFAPGVIFDGRSIVLSVAGVVGGGVTAAIAAGLAAIYRFQMGGAGAPVGITVALVSALLGVLARHWWLRRESPPPAIQYLVLGVVVQLAQLAAFTQIPDRASYPFIEQAWWVLLLFYPLATMLLCMIFRDQEQRQENQLALRAAQESAMRERSMLRTLIDTLPDLVWLKDQKGVYLACNPRFEQLFGAKEKDIVGKTDYDFVSHELADFFQHHDQLALAVGKPSVNEEWLSFASDGYRGLFETTKAPMYSAGGEVIGVLGIAHDITETRSKEQALRLASEQFRAVIDASPIPMALNDEALNITYVNSSFVRTFGYTLTDIPTVADWWPRAYPDPDYRAEVGRNWQARIDAMLQQDRQFEPLEVRIATRDGSTLTCLVASTVLPKGIEAIQLVTMIDVTETKAIQEELTRHRGQLEHLVEERTRELTVAKEAAEVASTAKSAFLANMSHEIRTPLNTITGLVHILRRSGFTPEQLDRLDKIEAAGKHLLEIINAVLDLSKIEARKFDLKEAEVCIPAIVENVAAMIRPGAEAKQLRLSTEVGALPPSLTGDATRLQQALINFASNAVKFTHQGSISLRAGLAEDRGDAVVVRFEVEDSGVGIDEAALPRLFGAFEQADSSLTREFGGTGLGLAITRNIAQLMGGDAGVSSQAGVGSTFWFTACLKKSSAASAAPPAVDSANPEAQLKRRFTGARVLVVDDEPMNRSVFGEFLALAGLEAIQAGNGLQAVDAVERQSFDLILMDMQMPRMDGLMATRKIRTLPNGRTVPILALTGNAFDADRARCLAAGMNDFITKPLQTALFYQTLLRWLTLARGDR